MDDGVRCRVLFQTRQIRAGIVAASFALVALGPARAEDGIWHFEKISKYDRAAEPVAIGMPFPKGVFRESQRLELRDGEKAVPSQATVTGRWPDGSARWVFVRALVDLPGNQAHRIAWRLVEGKAPAITTALKTSRLPDGSVTIETGPLAATLNRRGFLPLADVRLNGKPVGEMRGFTIRSGAKSFATTESEDLRIDVVETGPVAAVIRVAGRHGGAESPFDMLAELTFWSGKPFVMMTYRVLATRGEGEIPVDSWDWTATQEPGKPRLRVADGYYSTRVRESDSRAAVAFGAEQFRFAANEHSFQSYWGDFWCDWAGADAGLAVTLRQAQQNYPKAMDVTPLEMKVSLYPAGDEALRFPLGAAKTHQMMFHLHAGGTPTSELSARSLQYQMPDIPKLPPDWYGRCAIWDEKVFEGPRSERIEAILCDTLDDRPVGMGIWNFGDEVDWGYTIQGRGRDDVVWLNNEYDLAHLIFIAYARSGERRFLDYAFAGALHWRDVDIAHVARDPKRLGGHITHSARHVTGGVAPSHQWVEGLIDAYHFFGDRLAYEAAMGIGENILRFIALPQYRDPGNTSTRDMGWALRAMVALYRETGDGKYLDAGRPIVELFKRWHAEYPGMLAPYTDHSMVRVNFMNALTLVSLARYHRYAPSEELERLILAETDEMIAHGRNANGLFYYKELPSLARQRSTLLPLELLGEAYRLSGDRKYIEAGLPELRRAVDSGGLRLYVHGGAAEKILGHTGGYTRALLYVSGGKGVSVQLMPLLEFLSSAKDPDLIRQLDQPLKFSEQGSARIVK